MSALEQLKVCVRQPFDQLKEQLLKGPPKKLSLRRLSLRGSNLGFCSIRQLDIEHLLTKSGMTISSNRVFVESVDCPEYAAIGWVLHEGISNCMFCGAHFNAMHTKHNCAACGLVACSNCTANSNHIAELHDNRKHRVCVNCYVAGEDTIKAIEKYKVAPKGRVTESITAQANHDSTNDETNSIVTDSTAPGDGPALHLSFMKSAAAKPLNEIQGDLKRAKAGHAIARRKSFLSNSSQGTYLITDLIEETVKIGETESHTVHRVYVTSTTGGTYCDLGWIIRDEVTHCMECAKAFGTFKGKYHCKACGDVVCSSCSANKRKVVELGPVGPQRVCGRCATHDDAVHIKYRRSGKSGNGGDHGGDHGGLNNGLDGDFHGHLDGDHNAAHSGEDGSGGAELSDAHSLEQTPPTAPFCYCYFF